MGQKKLKTELGLRKRVLQSQFRSNVAANDFGGLEPAVAPQCDDHEDHLFQKNGGERGLRRKPPPDEDGQLAGIDMGAAELRPGQGASEMIPDRNENQTNAETRTEMAMNDDDESATKAIPGGEDAIQPVLLHPKGDRQDREVEPIIDPAILPAKPTYKPSSYAKALQPLDSVPSFYLMYQLGDIIKHGADRSVVVRQCFDKSMWEADANESIDAVSCQGVWGTGVALALKRALPAAFKVYAQHCETRRTVQLVGTCLLIPPQSEDYEVTDRGWVAFSPRRWIACLFTSIGYGRKKSRPGNPGKGSVEEILKNTRSALFDFRKHLESFGPSNFDTDRKWITDDEKPGDVNAVRFNAGAFRVPWEQTAQVIEDVFEGFERPWTVVDFVAEPDRTPQEKFDGKRSLGMVDLHDGWALSK